MTPPRDRNSTRLAVGDRVRAVDASEPDSGRVTRLLGADSAPYDVEVSWDSGVRTAAVSADLEVLR